MQNQIQDLNNAEIEAVAGGSLAVIIRVLRVVAAIGLPGSSTPQPEPAPSSN